MRPHHPELCARRHSPRLALAVEVACLAPAAALLALGLIGWSGHFWLTRQIQHAADAALAAASAEIDADARESRARAVAERVLATRLHLRPGDMRLSLASHSQRLTLILVYDASWWPAFALGGLTPMPSSTIVRQASGPARPD